MTEGLTDKIETTNQEEAMNTVEATSLTVNGVEYVPKGTVSVDRTGSPVRIVILQRGWVMVGYWSQDGDQCALDQAAVIRNWGTTKGLPEIVSGPTNASKIDTGAGHVEFHALAVVASLAADEGGWRKWLL